MSQQLLAGQGGDGQAGAHVQDPLGGQGHLPAGLGKHMEPLAFQFQDDAQKNALIFEEFDNIAGFHSGQNVTKSPQKSRKAGGLVCSGELPVCGY